MLPLLVNSSIHRNVFQCFMFLNIFSCWLWVYLENAVLDILLTSTSNIETQNQFRVFSSRLERHTDKAVESVCNWTLQIR